MNDHRSHDNGWTPERIQSALQKTTIIDRAYTALRISQDLISQGRTSEALRTVDLAWKLGTKDPSLLSLLVELLEGSGRARDALDRCREAALFYLRDNNLPALFSAVEMGQLLALESHLYANDDLLYQPLSIGLKGKRCPTRPFNATPPYRIGYVLWGDDAPFASLPRLFLQIANNHNNRLFKPVFFSAYNEAQLPLSDPTSAVSRIRSSGFEFEFNNRPAASNYERALNLAEQISNAAIDIVVFQSQMAMFYVTALLRPAPLILGFDHGDPGVYSSTALDYTLTAVPRFTVEHMTNSIALPPAYLADMVAESPPAIGRHALNIPNDAILLMTSGFLAKFDKNVASIPQYFEMMNEVMLSHPNTYWCIVGITEAEIPHLLPLLAPSVRSRVRFTGLVKNITTYLKACDIYVDTYPISGGLTVHEAMLLGIPTFTFRFGFNGPFNKLKEYSSVGDYLKEDSLHLVAANIPAIKTKLEAMITSPKYRIEHANPGRETARALFNTSHFVGALERVYASLIEDLLEQNNAQSPRTS